MREENKQKPTPQKSNVTKQRWFWPVIYASFSILLVAGVWGYSAFTNSPKETGTSNLTATNGPSSPSVETNATPESLKYPFKEALLKDAKVLQDYYDVEASEESREGALLVFNQTFTTSDGIAIAVKGESFDVLAALSGTVEEVKNDPFVGNEITISHSNGMTTKYSSVGEITVKKGDKVDQGQKLGKAISNEFNPTAGTHLYFEVMQEGKHINPKSLLAF
ncbi:peptidoglycan DD-metalloendopeptidase family protein [Rummeliibacillus sp. NPDC094406]|uniref:peptidoglycan DD-metalloendopeptidase family protein n=1 Tax=Rummeliibacillus sp. NPDC094406 TaxID=3364511 RepID=UPI0038262968